MKRVHEDDLRDMLENAEKALSFVNGMNFEEFTTDDKPGRHSSRQAALVFSCSGDQPKPIPVFKPFRSIVKCLFTATLIPAIMLPSEQVLNRGMIAGGFRSRPGDIR